MRINTRFSVAVHMLALIGLQNDGSVNSELLAKSVSTNPVVIRRLSSQLKKAGLIDIRVGVGGTTLTRPPERITLLDVYHAVQDSKDPMVFDVHQNPNCNCYVGAHIHDAIAEPLAAAQNAMEKKLAAFTIRFVMDQIVKQIRANG